MLNLTDIKILQFLTDNSYDSKINSAKVKDIYEGINYGRVTVGMHCKELLNNNYIKEGFANGRAVTYYISDEGKSYVKEHIN